MKKIKGGIITVIFLVSLLAVINPVSANGYYVHNIDTGDDFATVQNAIDDLDTLDGHTITIDAVTLTEWNISVNKDLTIKGTGPGLTIIDGEAHDSVFVIASGKTVSMSDMTITDGNSDTGDGGGIRNYGTLTMENCTVSGNDADDDGGGICNFDTLTMENCTVSGNTAYEGGGIYNDGTLTITNCTVSDNEADDYGGGIENGNTLTMNNCTVSGNTATFGGGIRNGGTLTMTNCTVSDNEAVWNGGGIYNGGGGTLTMTNCTVSDNTATFGGGGGIENGNTLTMTNCTVSDNTATFGGGIRNRDTLNAKNTIFANNSASSGPDIYRILNSYGYNLIEDTTDCTITEVANPGTNITGVDPNLGPLANNGGATETHALLSGSPAIDTGDCTDINGNPVTTDQRGVSRPQGSGCDIGAYEVEVPQLFANPIAAFLPVKNYHLRQVNTCLECIEENLPEDVPEDVQTLLDEMQEHINNANTTGNTIYANNELLKALKCAEDIQEKLGITCPL